MTSENIDAKVNETNVVEQDVKTPATKSKGKRTTANHKKAVIPETKTLSERREQAKYDALKEVEPTLNIEFKTSVEDANTVPKEELKPVEIDETVTIEEPVVETKPIKEAVKEMNSDTSVVIDAQETYFEKLYRKQEEKDKETQKDESFSKNMIPTVTTIDDNILDKVKPAKKPGKYTPTVAVSEVLKSADELEEGMCQYIVNALYIIDSNTNMKYLQGCMVTLPEDITKLSKVFLLAAKSGRLVKCQDFQRKIVRESQVYDTRTKKWIKEGTPEYDEYQKKLQKEQDKIAARNENKINQERKRLRID